MEQALGPILIGIAFAGLVIGNMPKEPIFDLPEAGELTKNGHFDAATAAPRSEMDKKSKNSSDV